jgi:NAD(P)-dependent dehydrogenase (short-subunit alcohol dehydrogenase family)
MSGATEDTVVLVTGATDGLGRGVAERLAADGASVHLHGRNADRLDAARQEIAATTGSDRLHIHLADLASLDDVRRLADEVQESTDRLDVLVNNAGIGSGRPDSTERQESRDGYELRFAVNYLAGFLLTVRLLPLLRRSAPARVVMVSSLGQAPLDFGDIMLEEDYDGTRAYCQSKLAQVSLAQELAERIDPAEVTFTSLHPSTFMPTKIVLEERGSPVDSLEQGVEATTRLAVSPELEGVTGTFYDRFDEAAALDQSYDPEARRRLWQLSLELTGEADPFAG